ANPISGGGSACKPFTVDAQPSPVPSPSVISLSTAEGPPGTQMTVSGTGYPVNASVTVYIGDPSHPLGTTASKADGTWSTNVTIPDLPSKQYQINTQPAATTPALFQVDPKPSPTP